MKQLSRRSLASTAVLSMVAGFVDALGFVHLGGYFVSFMTGNSTRAAVDLAAGRFNGWLLAIGLVVSFVFGVMAGTGIGLVAEKRRSVTTLLLVAGIIAVATVLATFGSQAPSGLLLAAGMGSLNTVFTRNGEVAVGITYMTGTLVKLGQSLVGALTGGDRRLWPRHLLLWSMIGIGATGGTLAYRGIGAPALWGAVAALLGMAWWLTASQARPGSLPGR